MRTMKHWALAAAAAAALALAGCGGGGSSSAPPQPPGPTLADMQMEQRNAISSAITAAETAVAGVNDDSTDSEVSAADTAVTAARQAIANAADVPAEETASDTRTVNAIANRLTAAKTSRTAAIDEADKANRAAMAKTGKALHAALAGPATDNTALDNLDSVPSIGSTGLSVDAAAGAGTLADDAAHAEVVLKAGDSAGALGSWNGTDYAHSAGTGDAKVTNEARVYTNKGPGKQVSFTVAGHTVATETAGEDFKGYVTLDESADFVRIMGDAFTHSGIQNHSYDADNEVAFYTRGTYDGASGKYRCTGTCTSTNDGKGSPSALGGIWHFKPDAGANAMVSQPDDTYLYYGWWVSKDSKGVPTAASAFTGIVQPTTPLPAVTDGSSLTGSATYAGNAAGKFAMNNVLDGTGNGGHFTADAELNATFGTGVTAGVTGTIDNFRLNDGSEDPGWSVALNDGGLGSAGAIDAPTGDDALGTVWSINGNKAPASGTWSGQMYDEMPGNAPSGDGSNIPTTVTGTFYSEFSTVGRMVGAFGASKED